MYKYQGEFANPDVMKSLIKNSYGFYVIQKLVNEAKDTQMVDKIKSEAEKCLIYVSDRNLKQKWVNLIYNSK